MQPSALIPFCSFGSKMTGINNSYTNWEASPIATSISTHPISELDFPTITVCPPEGSNTALNYDLVRARNITLTEKDRDSLLTRTTQILIDKPSEEFVHVARSLLSEENILDIFESTPTSIYPMVNNHFNHNTPSYEIWTSKLNGSYKTPWFGDNYPCNQTIVEVNFVLELPLVVQDKADDIVFEIQVQRWGALRSMWRLGRLPSWCKSRLSNRMPWKIRRSPRVTRMLLSV